MNIETLLKDTHEEFWTIRLPAWLQGALELREDWTTELNWLGSEILPNHVMTLRSSLGCGDRAKAVGGQGANNVNHGLKDRL